ncbi:DUF6730 family protein [Gramella sp. AN32]|uniref:DUF6730 family protein n=1 Tax=Christiangramia antarctica TaxID=2058158 RepID=A0ABW5XBC8_9FLAO|nr:DUF6730 family protein [Gramella sp. AN32]MCM4155455.1 hypothetical protein [Gramella sp. AN32]
MKKLDEIMELMTDEMADFKVSVLQLKEHSKELQNMSIPITTEALEKNLNTFLEKQEAKNELLNEILKGIDKKLLHGMIIPNYILVIFGILGILMVGLLGYFGYTTKAAKDEKFEFFQMMLDSENQYQDYFSENPELKENYLHWLEAKK